MISLKNSRHRGRRRRPRRGHVVGGGTTLNFIPAWTPRVERRDCTHSARGGLFPAGVGKGPERNSAHPARAGLKAGAQGQQTAPRARGRFARPERRAGQPPRRARRTPLARAGRAAPVGCSPAGSRERGASPCGPRRRGGPDTSGPAAPAPAPRSPTPLTRQEPATSECPRCARRGCARPAPGCGRGSGRSGRCRCRSGRWEPSGCRRRRRRLHQQVSIKVLVRSLFPHSRRAQRRLQLFQNTRPVPPTPTSAVAPGEGWGVQEGDGRGGGGCQLSPRTCVSPDSGSLNLLRGVCLHLRAGAGDGRPHPQCEGSDDGIHRAAGAGSPPPTAGLPCGPPLSATPQSWFLTKTPNHYAIFIQTMTFGQFFF